MLDPVDEWLFLAYHYGLHHRFSGLKWLADIYYSTLKFTADDWDSLLRRAADAGLNKTVLATLQALERIYTQLPDFCRLLGLLTAGKALDATQVPDGAFDNAPVAGRQQ